MKRVLITGGAGFIGHHVFEHFLKNTDWEIVVLDRLSYAGNLNRISDIEIFDSERERFGFVYHDLRAALTGATLRLIGNVDYIVHLAAESHVDRSIEDAIPFVESNVVGTTNLLIYARDHQPDLSCFINFGTDEVFGPAPLDVRFEEEAAWRPSNPYAASKCGQTAMGMAFARTYGMPVINTFTMNNFGERQHPEKFIPSTVRKVLAGVSVIIHGTPKSVGSRCWLHARNTADALLFLLEHGDRGELYNIVGDTELDNLVLARTIAEILSKPLVYEFMDFHLTRPGHDRRYALSGDKIRKAGWHPPLDFESSLENCIRWMLNRREWLES